jgi:CBS domain-containing protein
MTLIELLRGKGNEIFRIKFNDCVAVAAEVLTEKKIGAVLVEDDAGNIVGILSERDIVGGLPLHGAALHNVEVSELMTIDLITCAPYDTVNQAMALMNDRNIRHLPIFEGNELMGIISIRDLLQSIISEVQNEANAMRQYISN